MILKRTKNIKIIFENIYQYFENISLFLLIFLYIFDVYNEIYNGKKLCTFDLMYLYYCSKPNGYF